MILGVGFGVLRVVLDGIMVVVDLVAIAIHSYGPRKYGPRKLPAHPRGLAVSYGHTKVPGPKTRLFGL